MDEAGRVSHPFDEDHAAVEFGAVQVLDAARRVLDAGHRHVTVAPIAGHLSARHHFGADHLLANRHIKDTI